MLLMKKECHVFNSNVKFPEILQQSNSWNSEQLRACGHMFANNKVFFVKILDTENTPLILMMLWLSFYIFMVNGIPYDGISVFVFVLYGIVGTTWCYLTRSDNSLSLGSSARQLYICNAVWTELRLASVRLFNTPILFLKTYIWKSITVNPLVQVALNPKT